MKHTSLILSLSLISILSIASVSAVKFNTQAKETEDLLIVPLEKDVYGNYFIEANLDFNSTVLKQQNAAQDSPSVTNIGKMLVNLYSNETFIASCSRFGSYSSEEFDYSQMETPARLIEFLYDQMRLIGYDVEFDIQTPAFTLINFPAVHAVICDAGFKGDDHGYLGLGSGKNLIANTLTNFSIIANNDKETPTDLALYVGSQEKLRTKYNTSSFSMTAKTKDNWALTMLDLQVTLPGDAEVYNLNTLSSYNVIFDLNTEAIAVPVNLYKFITTVLQGYNVVCSEDKHSTTCNTTGADLKSLPTFGLVIGKTQDGENVISLTPDLYFDEEKDRLLIKSISDDDFGLLKINPSYNRAVVLGAPFLRKFNVHFAHAHHETFVTIENSRPLSNIKTNTIVIVIAIALISYFAVVGLGYLCYTREFKKGIFEREPSVESGLSRALMDEEVEQNEREEFTVTILNGKKTVREEARTASSSLIEN